MSSQEEPGLGGDNRIFPLLNRRTPVLDRIRERRRLRNNIGLSVGKRVGEAMLEEDEEERVMEAQRIASDFREGLSDELGVPPEAISDELVQDFMALFAVVSEEDVVEEIEGDEEGGSLFGEDGEDEEEEE